MAVVRREAARERMRAEAARVEAVVEAEMGRLVADGVRQAEAERVVREARVAGRQAAAGTIQRFVRGVGVRRTAREAEIAEAERVEAEAEAEAERVEAERVLAVQQVEAVERGVARERRRMAEAERVEAVVRAEMGRLRLGWRGRGAGRGRGSGGGG
jgi:fused signal recognition particle receptor